MIKDQSSAENRLKGNIYTPFNSYTEYVDHFILLSAVGINEMLEGIPIKMIPDFWLINFQFRRDFKNVVKFAYFVHYEGRLNTIFPWCTFDIAEYAKKFEKERIEYFEKIERWAKGIYD